MPRTKPFVVSRCPARWLAILFLPFLLSSCGLWDNLTAYFNTYYNARRDFEVAEEEIWSTRETRDTGRNLLTPLVLQQTTRTRLTGVIEKCSKLLQYHPESNLVDDALWMIGMSFYYQGEWQRADRKFRELIDGYPGSDLAVAARILVAYTQYKSGDLAAAAASAEQIHARSVEDDDETNIAASALLLAQLSFDAKSYEAARGYFREVGEYADHPDRRAQAWLKAGDISALLGDYEDAENAYRKASRASTTFTGDFRSSIGIARMLARQEEFRESLELLDDLRANANFREYFGEIDLEIANVLRDEEDLEGAIEQYMYVDTAYVRTEVAANAALALGKVYEYQLMLYDSARSVYTRGRSIFPGAPVTPEIARRAEYFTRYFALYREMQRLDSIRTVLLTPPDTTPPAIVDSLRLDSLGRPKDSVRVSRPVLTISLDSIRSRTPAIMEEIGTLFYLSMGVTDSAEFWYRRVAEKFPESRVAPRALFILAEIAGSDSSGPPGAAEALYREVIEKYPGTAFAREAERLLGIGSGAQYLDPAEELYNQGALLLTRGSSEAAMETFRVVVRDFPSSPAAARAQYAIAWIYEQGGSRADSAIANYERLVAQYPTSPFTPRAQVLLAEVALARQAAARLAADSAAARAAADSAARRALDSSALPPVPATIVPDTAMSPPDTSATPLVEDPDDDTRKRTEPGRARRRAAPAPAPQKPTELPD